VNKRYQAQAGHAGYFMTEYPVPVFFEKNVFYPVMTFAMAAIIVSEASEGKDENARITLITMLVPSSRSKKFCRSFFMSTIDSPL